MNDADAAAESYCASVTIDPARENLWNTYAQFALTNTREAQFRQCVQDYASSEAAQASGMLPHIAAVSVARSDNAASLLQAASLLTDVVRTNNDRSALRAHGIHWAAPMVLDQLRAAGAGAPTELRIRAGALLGEVFQALGNYEIARGLLSDAMLRLAPPEGSAIATRLAAVQQSLNQPNDAVDTLRKAVMRDSQNGGLQLHYARALAKAGRSAEARLEYQTILKAYQLDETTLRQVQQEIQALGITPQRP